MNADKHLVLSAFIGVHRWPIVFFSRSESEEAESYEGGAARAVSAAARRRADESGGHPPVLAAQRPPVRCHQPHALPARGCRWRVLPGGRGRADAVVVASS